MREFAKLEKRLGKNELEKKMVEKQVKNDFVSYNQVFDINRKLI